MSGVEAARASGAMPGPVFADGKITFYCPNGHRLVVAAIHAGKRGKCDRAGCGVAVTIPVPPAVIDPGPEAPEADQDHVEPVELSAVDPERPVVPVPVTAPVVPVAAPVPEPSSRVVAAGPPTGDPEPASAGPVSTGWEFIGAGAEPDPPRSETAPPAADATVGAENATARLVAQLWKEREHGGVVELHLVGGSVILPEWYEPTWSRGSHGLFARQEPDGTVTITAVAWDTIQRVVVRQVRGLPDSMAFE